MTWTGLKGPSCILLIIGLIRNRILIETLISNKLHLSSFWHRCTFFLNMTLCFWFIKNYENLIWWDSLFSGFLLWKRRCCVAGCTLLQCRPVATGPPCFCKFYILAYIPPHAQGQMKVHRWLLTYASWVRLPAGPQRHAKLFLINFFLQSQPNLHIEC